MHMVGHNDVRVDRGVGKVGWDLLPAILYDLPIGVQLHPTVSHLSEQFSLLNCTDGDEIRSRLGVVVSLETD